MFCDEITFKTLRTRVYEERLGRADHLERLVQETTFDGKSMACSRY